MQNKYKIILSEELIKQLINAPETGMGYHKVDIHLKNGEIIKNQIIFNCSILNLDGLFNIVVDDIVRIEVK